VPGTIKILFLAAHSSSQNAQTLMEEASAIEKRIKQSKYRDFFTLITAWSIRPTDLPTVLLEHQPHIVHLSGRGSEAGGVILESDNDADPLDDEAVATLFRILKDNIRVVVFNAAYSEQQTRKLMGLIDYSIGLNTSISPEAAISFSAAFYQALAYARTVTEAFDLATLELRLEGKPGFDAPVLHVTPHVDTFQSLLDVLKQTTTPELAVDRYAKLARSGLDPYILPRISRSVVQGKYIPAILRGIEDGRERVVPIIGPAGYGKSTILGDIYDQLSELQAGWIALVRCNDLVIDNANLSIEQFSTAIGEGACGVSRSFTQVAEDLTAQKGRGVLLLDTVDIILNAQLVPVLRGALIQLLNSHTTVVFTCRDYEYAAFLEPTSDRLAGILESVDRYQVPAFAREEIINATLGFIQANPEINLRDQGQAFANSILDLSADNRSLREIVSNPLLLAMLCELFAAEGLVPQDLTVSKLYRRYWEEKIDKSRKFGPQSPETIRKRRLCLEVAKTTFDHSREHFQDSIYERDLDLAATPVVSGAYAELFSEGVLKTQPNGKIGFFHQTFLEYTIARWLATASGAASREQLLDTLRDAGVTGVNAQWWAVIRQLLTIVDKAEFDRLVKLLDLSDLATFRTVAYATVSNADESQVRRLLARALELGSEHQNILRDAIEVAPTSLAEPAWEVALALVAQAEWPIAVKAAQAAGQLVARHDVLDQRIPEILAACQSRLQSIEFGPDDRQTNAELVGWFLSAILAAADTRLSTNLLSTLRDRYKSLSEGNQLMVIGLHLVPGVAREDQLSLLEQVTKETAPLRFKEALTQLTERLIVSNEPRVETIFGKSLVEALHAQLPDGWEKIQARAVGRHLKENPIVLEAIINDLFQGHESRIGQNQKTLVEAAEHGASDEVVKILLRTSVKTMPAARAATLVSILQHLAPQISSRRQQDIVFWLLQEQPDKALEALAFLRNDSPAVGELLLVLLPRVSANDRARFSKRILRNSSDRVTAAIAGKLEQQLLSDLPNVETEIALAELYGVLAKSSEPAIEKLVGLSLKNSERVARAASRKLMDLAASQSISVVTILQLARSRIAGVRLNCLGALRNIAETRAELNAADLASAYAAFANERQEPVLQSLFQLSAIWVTANKQVPAVMISPFAELLSRLLEDEAAGAGTVRVLIKTVKVFAQTEDPATGKKVGELARTLLGSVNLEKIDDGESEMIDLLSAVARRDRSFLNLIVDDCADLPWRNARAVASSVKRVEGAGSVLLDRLLTADWCSPAVKNFILTLRGL
jgi:hypothetical protein